MDQPHIDIGGQVEIFTLSMVRIVRRVNAPEEPNEHNILNVQNYHNELNDLNLLDRASNHKWTQINANTLPD
jgi:hypothetical protein